MAMVMPRSRSSGALSILSKERTWACPCKASVLVMAAVRLVLPWSTCPIVPTFTCGLVRANFCFPMVPAAPLALSLTLSDVVNPLRAPTRDRRKLRRLELISPRLGDHLLSDSRRQRRIMIELHRIRGPSLGCRAEICCVPEHARQWHECPDDLGASAHFHALNMPAPSVEIANNVAHELVRRGDLDLHDRLENHIPTPSHALFECERSGD